MGFFLKGEKIRNNNQAQGLFILKVYFVARNGKVSSFFCMALGPLKRRQVLAQALPFLFNKTFKKFIRNSKT
jgi:hypothetical protein